MSLKRRLEGGHEGKRGRHCGYAEWVMRSKMYGGKALGAHSLRDQAVERRIWPGMGRSSGRKQDARELASFWP